MGMRLFSTSSPDITVYTDRLEQRGRDQAKSDHEAEMAEIRDKIKEVYDYVVGNPVPHDYEVVRWEEYENTDTGADVIVVEMRYASCKNYDGRKVLVFDDVEDFWTRVEDEADVDPHFLENDTSPVARFEPTERGWTLATELAQAML